MLKIKYIKQLKVVTLCAVVTGFLFGFPGCLEKELVPETNSNPHLQEPFGLFKIHLKLIDNDSKEPISDLFVRLLGGNSPQPDDLETAGQVTDSTGLAHIVIASVPPAPQEFILSFSDTTKTRIFQQGYISVFFTLPVFTYIPKDAAKWGRLYQ